MVRALIGLAIMLSSCLPYCAAAQSGGAFDPFPDGSASAYQFSLARNFYPSAEAGARARAELVRRFNALAPMSARVQSADRLLNTLRLLDTLGRELGRQYAYLSLRSAVDTRDAEAQRDRKSVV